MEEFKLELAFILGLVFLIALFNVYLHAAPQEQIQDYAVNYVPNGIIIVSLALFTIRAIMLRKIFGKKIVLAPIKPYHYKLNYIVDAIKETVFFTVHLGSISFLAISFFAFGFGAEAEGFENTKFFVQYLDYLIIPYLAILSLLISKHRWI